MAPGVRFVNRNLTWLEGINFVKHTADEHTVQELLLNFTSCWRACQSSSDLVSISAGIMQVLCTRHAAKLLPHLSSYRMFSSYIGQKQTVAHILKSATAVAGGPAVVEGWVRTVRSQKAADFMQISDGTCQKQLQIVAPPGTFSGMTTGCSVRVSGVLAASPAKGQALELQADNVRVVGTCDPQSYPLQKKGHSVEFLRSIPHLRGRSNLMGAVLRLRNALSQSIHGTLQEAGCLHVHTPILTSNDCEGAGELFSVSSTQAAAAGQEGGFFGRPTYLTVSGQLHAEAFAVGAGPVYTFGPTFRAEDSNTSRHLCEFWMVEPELPWASLPDAMALAERVTKRAVQQARERCDDDLHFCGQFVDKNTAARLDSVLPAGGDAEASTFARMTHAQAVAALQGSGECFSIAPDAGRALATEHEKWLCEQHVQGPVFVTDYPAAVKPFYMLQNDDGDAQGEGGTVACMDLLVPKLAELVGGSAREHREEHLRRAMGRAGLLQPDGGGGDLQWYLDLRRYGSVPHAGWGMGFERLVQFVSGVDNIRDAIPVPRAPGLCPM